MGYVKIDPSDPAFSARTEAVRDLWTEAARDNAIRGQIDDDHRADMTDRRRTGDY